MSFNNMYVGYNNEEDFRILIVADNLKEAEEAAAEYNADSHFTGSFEISEVTNLIDCRQFDCDYVITAAQNRAVTNPPHFDVNKTSKVYIR